MKSPKPPLPPWKQELKQFKPRIRVKPITLAKKESETKTVKEHFIKRVKELGGKSYPFKSQNNNGVSDRIAIFPGGNVWFCELKTQKGKERKLQTEFRIEVRKLGAKATTLHGKKGIDAWISRDIQWVLKYLDFYKND